MTSNDLEPPWITGTKLFLIGNLESTASTMTPFFSKIPEWKGFSGSGNPKSDVMTQELNRRSLYVFCGHGSGSDAVGGWGRMIRKGIKSHCHLIGKFFSVKGPFICDFIG